MLDMLSDEELPKYVPHNLWKVVSKQVIKPSVCPTPFHKYPGYQLSW
jgi:hypothetical protein